MLRAKGIKTKLDGIAKKVSSTGTNNDYASDTRNPQGVASQLNHRSIGLNQKLSQRKEEKSFSPDSRRLSQKSSNRADRLEAFYSRQSNMRDKGYRSTHKHKVSKDYEDLQSKYLSEIKGNYPTHQIQSNDHMGTNNHRMSRREFTMIDKNRSFNNVSNLLPAFDSIKNGKFAYLVILFENIDYINQVPDPEQSSKRLFKLTGPRNLSETKTSGSNPKLRPDGTVINSPPLALLKQIKATQNIAQITQNIRDISRRLKLDFSGKPRLNGNDDSSWVKDVSLLFISLITLHV